MGRFDIDTKNTRLLRWAHFLGPGFVILIAALSFGAAFILQLLVAIGLPSIHSIYFLEFTFSGANESLKFGLWTICTHSYYSDFTMSNYGENCQKNSLGYTSTQFSSITDVLILPGLGRALIVQPIATGLAAITVPMLLLHTCSNIVFFPFVCALASAFSILAFVFEIIVFGTVRSRLGSSSIRNEIGAINGIKNTSFGPGIWIQLAAMALVCFATFLDWTAYIRRKLRATHKAKFGRSNKHIKEDDLWTSDVDPNAKSSRGKVNLTDLRSQAMGWSSSKVAAGGVIGKRLRARVMGRGARVGDKDEEGSNIALKSMGAPTANEKRYSKRHIPLFGESTVEGEEDAKELDAAYASRKMGKTRSVGGPINRGSTSNLSKRTKYRSAPMGEYVAGGAAGAGLISYASRRRRSDDTSGRDRPKSGLESRHRQRSGDDSDGQGEEWYSDEGGNDQVLFDRDAEDPADLNYLLGARRRSEPSEPSEAGTRLEQRHGRRSRVVSGGALATSGGRRRSSAQGSEDDGAGSAREASSKRHSEDTRRSKRKPVPEYMDRAATESPTTGHRSSRRHTARSRGYQLDAAEEDYSEGTTSPRATATPEPRYSATTSRRGVSASPTPSRVGGSESPTSHRRHRRGSSGAASPAATSSRRDGAESPTNSSRRPRPHSSQGYNHDRHQSNRRKNRPSSLNDPFADRNGSNESLGTSTSMMRDRVPLGHHPGDGDGNGNGQDDLVSPRRGKRAARYSARMASEDF